MKLKKPNLVLTIGDTSPRASYALFPALFYLANLFRMTGNTTVPYILCIYLFGAIGLISFFVSKRFNRAFVLFAAIYFIGSLFNILLIGNITVNDLVADILFWGIAYIMLTNPCTYLQGTISFYITFVSFILSYFRGTNTHVVLTSSGNYISVLLVISASLYYLALQYSNRKIVAWDMIPAFLCFFLAIWAKGRSGIITTGILAVLILLLFVREITSKNAKRIVLVIAILLIIGLILFITDTSISSWFFSLGKLGYRGADNSARQEIWGSYLTKMEESIGYVLFGAPIKDIYAIAIHGGNCHNSFIQLHAYTGLLSFVTFFVFLIKAFLYYIRNNKLIIAAMLLVFCIRAFTDKFVFGQYGMPLMVFFVMRPYFDEPGRQIQSIDKE